MPENADKEDGQLITRYVQIREHSEQNKQKQNH